MRQLATVTNVGNSSPTTTARRSSSAEADDVSLLSVGTGSEVDAGLQETYIGLVSNIVIVVMIVEIPRNQKLVSGYFIAVAWSSLHQGKVCCFALWRTEACRRACHRQASVRYV